MNSHSRDIRWGNDKKVMIINVKCVGEKKNPQFKVENLTFWPQVVRTSVLKKDTGFRVQI